MSPHLAPVKNESDQDSASAAAKPVRARQAKKAAKEKVPFLRSEETDEGWCLRYEADYESLSQQARQERAERRQRQRSRPSAPATPEEAMFADMRRERRKSLQSLIDLRWLKGFKWRGGPFAGNMKYRRDPLRCIGLVSDRHPILKLFASKVSRAKRLRVGDEKGVIHTTDSKLLGLDAAYVEANKTMCGILRIEVDAILTWDDIEATCIAAGVPLPNVAVGWEDPHGRVHNPHLIWLLHNSVPLEGELCSRFRGLFRGVLRGLTKALLPVGADVGGLLNAHRHKSPLCPLWHRRIYAEQPYHLSQLAEAPGVDITTRMEALKRLAVELRGDAVLSPDHPDPAIAGARTGCSPSWLSGHAARSVRTVRRVAATTSSPPWSPERAAVSRQLSRATPASPSRWP